jgi:hypothetical protein
MYAHNATPPIVSCEPPLYLSLPHKLQSRTTRADHRPPLTRLAALFPAAPPKARASLAYSPLLAVPCRSCRPSWPASLACTSSTTNGRLRRPAVRRSLPPPSPARARPRTAVYAAPARARPRTAVYAAQQCAARSRLPHLHELDHERPFTPPSSAITNWRHHANPQNLY